MSLAGPRSASLNARSAARHSRHSSPIHRTCEREEPPQIATNETLNATPMLTKITCRRHFRWNVSSILCYRINCAGNSRSNCGKTGKRGRFWAPSKFSFILFSLLLYKHICSNIQIGLKFVIYEIFIYVLYSDVTFKQFHADFYEFIAKLQGSVYLNYIVL